MYSIDDPQLNKYATMFADGYRLGVLLELQFIKCEQIKIDYPGSINCNMAILVEAKNHFFSMNGYTLSTVETFCGLLNSAFEEIGHRDIAQLCVPYKFPRC